MVDLKPLTTAMAIIMMATLMAVAMVASRIINLEKPEEWLPAMRLAM